MADAFAVDEHRRETLAERLCAVRGALADAYERADGAAALVALGELYRVVDEIPDAQVLYVPGESHKSFVLPEGGFSMQAKYAGRCSLCSGPIAMGQLMHWYKVDRTAVCMSCLGGAAISAGAER